MSKQLVITDPNTGKDYTLEYNRKSILRALKSGLDPEAMASGGLETILMIPLLFNCAFDMHHGVMDEKETDAIYELIPDKAGLSEALAEMFADPIDALAKEPEGAKSKNFKWKKTW